MINKFKENWKLIVFLTVLIIAVGLSNYIYINNILKSKQKIQLENIDLEADKAALIEQKKKDVFNRTIQKSKAIITKKQKQADEIKESIENPTVDFYNDIYQDSLDAKFKRRYP